MLFFSTIFVTVSIQLQLYGTTQKLMHKMLVKRHCAHSFLSKQLDRGRCYAVFSYFFREGSFKSESSPISMHKIHIIQKSID